MDRNVGQSGPENKSERTPLYIEKRREWWLALRDVHVAGGRRFVTSAKKEGCPELVLTPSLTAHEALERIRAAVDDLDTIEAFRAAREDITRVGGRHFLTGGRR